MNNTINKMNFLNRGYDAARSGVQTRSFKIIDRFIDNLIDKSIIAAKSHFGVELTTGPLPDYKHMAILEFIKKYDKNYNKHITVRDKREYLENKELYIGLDKQTFMIVRTGNQIAKMMSDKEVLMKSNHTNGGYQEYNSYSNYYIYICGKHAYKYYRQLEKIMQMKNADLTCYKISGGEKDSHENFRSVASRMNTRRMETIFLEPGVVETVTEHIDKFLSHEEIYKERDLIYKTGILLKGEPGTGKTSLATAIATYCSCNMMVVDMSTFDTLKTAEFTDTINADDFRYVIVLEDIDCIVGNRNDGEEMSKEEKARLNKLLQFLDSNSSPTNVIFVATTNYPDRLDDALLREGRFDCSVSVKGIYYQRAYDMCASFGFEDKKIKQILQSIIDDPSTDVDLKNVPINQSKLQSIILKNIEDENKSVVE